MSTIDRSPIPRLFTSDPTLPPGATPEGTAGRVLTAALRLFAERGFAGASIRDIGQTAGVGSASLYSHYASKEHLLAELARIGHEEHLRRLRTALLDSPAEPTAQLAALVRAHVSGHATYPALATIVNNDLHALPPDLAGPALALRRQSEALLTEIVDRGVVEGAFHLDAPWLAAAAIGGMGIRVATWYTPGLGVTPEEVADEYVTYALRLVGHAG